MSAIEKSGRGKIYYGKAEATYKLRYANHRKFFNQKKSECNSELSNEYFRMKDMSKNTDVDWKTLERHKPYNFPT